jgi:preprotein translocase subunit YajC
MVSIDIGSLVASATLAQAGEGTAPPPTGPVVPGGPGATQAPGTSGPGTGGQGGGGGGMGFFLPLMLVMVVFLIMTSMAGRKEKKRRAAVLGGVKRGDRVQTVGGEIGTIVDLTETEMTLRVDEASNTRIRFARSALQQILKESKESGSPTTTAAT